MTNLPTISPAQAVRKASFWRYLAPFDFLRIEGLVSWRYYAIVVSLGGLCAYAVVSLPVRPQIITEAGILRDFRDLLAIMFPFFVGALAAIATATGRVTTTTITSYPDPTNLTQPKIEHVQVSVWDEPTPDGMKLHGQEITRRQFVCNMFGHLALVSGGLFLFIVFARAFAPSVATVWPDQMEWVRPLGLGLFLAGTVHMFVWTMWGLFYLINRLHRD